MSAQKDRQARIDEILAANLDKAIQKAIESWDGKGIFRFDVNIHASYDVEGVRR